MGTATAAVNATAANPVNRTGRIKISPPTITTRDSDSRELALGLGAAGWAKRAAAEQRLAAEQSDPKVAFAALSHQLCGNNPTALLAARHLLRTPLFCRRFPPTCNPRYYRQALISWVRRVPPGRVVRDSRCCRLVRSPCGCCR